MILLDEMKRKINLMVGIFKYLQTAQFTSYFLANLLGYSVVMFLIKFF